MSSPAPGSRSSDGSPPLYQQIKDWIRTSIAAGEYEPDEPFTTEKQLRERFGVSTATAVRALNDLVNEGVLVRKRARGTFVAEPVAGDPPRSAGAPRSIAYVAYGHGGPHQAAIMQGISAVCLDLGYRVFLTDTAASRDHERRAIQNAIEGGVDGVLWYPHDGEGDPRLLADLQRHRIPVVFIDRYLPSAPADAVLADNFAVGHKVSSELIARGHRRIATVWDEWQCTSVRDRLSGHLQALRDNTLPVAAELTALRPYLQGDASKRQARLRALLDHPDPPTAMVCANGFLLATVVHDLVTMGLRVPEDVDVAGMDDAGPFNVMPLATVAIHLPSREMGETAMRRLAQRISTDGSGPAEHVVLPVTLRTRTASEVYLRPVRERGTDVATS